MSLLSNMSTLDPLNNPEIKNVLAQLMKSEQGRTLVENLMPRFKELDEKYQSLPDDEKKVFEEHFKNKFLNTLLLLKDKLGIGEGPAKQFPSENRSQVQPSLLFFVVAVFLIVGALG